MKQKTLIATLALVLALAGTASAQDAAANRTAQGTYKIEPTHTFVTWEAKHFGTSTSRGRFDKKDGTIEIDAVAKKGSAEITIDMKSMNTGVAPFDKHLTGKDFFNADEFPTATFKGTDFKFDGDRLTEVGGTLTMLGKTNPVTLKATGFGCYVSPFFKRQVCGGDFETTIARTQWGMNYGVPGIPDNIRLLVQIEAIKQ
jgi:polyisoprenoid-binding protein YceI